jgi:nanoRNase/pAp phosphatase (c-di-AMP/oligoRNAs hydrolase)
MATQRRDEERAAPPRLSPHFGDQARAHDFTELLEKHRGEAHVIAIQDYPDPDAISSALAYRYMAERYDIRSDIVYEGRVSHQENLALIHVLEISLTRFTDALPLDRYQGSVFVDNQGTTTQLTERLAEAGVPPLAIIDHHAPQGVLEAEFMDIRPVGAAATILTDYLQNAQILSLERDNESHLYLATALVHGLRSETSSFIRAGPEEFLAAAYLSPYTDPQLLESILRVQRSRGTMEIIHIALTDRRVRG